MRVARMSKEPLVPPPVPWITRFGGLLIASPFVTGAADSRWIFALVVFGAALPFAGWPLPTAWLACMSALFLFGQAWRPRLASRLADCAARLNPFDWLVSAGYSAAAFYLVLFYGGAAQTFGVTLYGVVMFQILAKDYAAPRRLLANLAPPLIAVIVIQCAAIALRVAHGRPLEIVTVLASPYIVFRVFRAIQDNLTQSLARERDATAEALQAAQSMSEAHRIAAMAEQLAGVGHWRFDIATQVSTWSDGVFQIFGLDRSAAEPCADNLLSLYDPADRERVEEHLKRAINDGEPFAFEARVIRPDGEVRYVLANGAVEHSRESAAVATVFGALLDVTEARLREQALGSSEARFRLLADHCTDVVIWIDADGTILYASPSAKTLGYSPEAVVGRKTLDFVHPDDRVRAAEILSGLFTGEPVDQSVRREYRVLTGEGRYVWLEGNPTIIRGEHGQATSVVTSYRDVTARRQMEDDLVDAKLRAEAAAEAKAEFLANMSHEIRTPLTGIIGFSGLLGEMDALPEQARAYVRRIATSGRSLLSVVNDILDFSKLEAEQAQLDPQPFPIRSLFDQTIEVFSAQAAAKAVRLDLAIGDDLPAFVDVDAARLGQVLNNLVGNAVKFTDKGSITLAVEYGRDNNHLLVSVTDTGVGVPADRADRLFQRFSQADGSVTRRYGGTGLGLSICKGLVELMGGEISFTSTPGVGSCFEFWIAAPPAEAPNNVDDLRQTSLFEQDRPSRILVVDDLDVNRELIRVILEAVGQEVTEAAGGAEAVEASIQTPFDLIFMDLQMPGMDGCAAARAIRDLSEPNRFTPIVALSANVLPEHIRASAAAGMNDHLGKPVVPRDLIAAVGRWGAVRLDQSTRDVDRAVA